MLADGHNDVAIGHDGRGRAGRQHERGAGLLDHRWPCNQRSGGERATVVNRGRNVVARFMEIHRTLAAHPSAPSAATSERALRDGRGIRHSRERRDPDIDEFYGDLRWGSGELLAIGFLERALQCSLSRCAIGAVVGPLRQSRDKVKTLPGKASIGKTLHAQIAELEAGLRNHFARSGFERLERRLKARPIAVLQPHVDRGDTVDLRRRRE